MCALGSHSQHTYKIVNAIDKLKIGKIEACRTNNVAENVTCTENCGRQNLVDNISFSKFEHRNVISTLVYCLYGAHIATATNMWHIAIVLKYK